MKMRYIIKGTIRMGELVRLLLLKEDVVKKSGKMSILEMASNAQQVIQDQQMQAILTQQPDTVTISHEEWEKHQYKVDDIVWVDITPEMG